MNQVEDLKEFISQRLHAATSEILGAVVRSLSDFEEQTVRLKEENRRLRSVLDIVVESKLGRCSSSLDVHKEGKIDGAHLPISEPKIISRHDGPTQRSPAKYQPKTCRTSGGKGYTLTLESKCLFTSRGELLKVQDGDGNCPYCIKTSEATESHLLKRHYARAVHFIAGDTEKFVIPCMCKDKIQGRSHWHCPCCQKIIFRTCNFEAHLSKLHGYVTQQRNKSNGQSTMTHPEVQPSEDVQVNAEPEQNGNSQTATQNLDHAYDEELKNIVTYVSSFIPDTEMKSVHYYTRCVEPTPPSQPMVTDAECETSVSERLQYIPGKCAVADNVGSSQNKTSSQLPCSHNPTGSHSCKACGKVFPNMETLKAQVQTHTMNKKHTREKLLKLTKSSVPHLHCHTRRNTCYRCRKQFSCSSRLKCHMKIHRTKVLKAPGKGFQV